MERAMGVVYVICNSGEEEKEVDVCVVYVCMEL